MYDMKVPDHEGGADVRDDDLGPVLSVQDAKATVHQVEVPRPRIKV